MASQIAKRLAKEKAAKEKSLGETLIEAADEAVTAEEVVPAKKKTKDTDYTAIDIFTDPATKKHMAAIITYDPVTMECKIREIKPVQRGISLQFEINKKALRTLVREKK